MKALRTVAAASPRMPHVLQCSDDSRQNNQAEDNIQNLHGLLQLSFVVFQPVEDIGNNYQFPFNLVEHKVIMLLKVAHYRSTFEAYL